MNDVMKDIFNSGSKPFILLGNAAFYSEKLCLLRLLEREGILLRAEGGDSWRLSPAGCQSFQLSYQLSSMTLLLKLRDIELCDMTSWAP